MTELGHKLYEYIFAIQNSVLWYTCLWFILLSGSVKKLSGFEMEYEQEFQISI